MEPCGGQWTWAPCRITPGGDHLPPCDLCPEWTCYGCGSGAPWPCSPHWIPQDSLRESGALAERWSLEPGGSQGTAEPPLSDISGPGQLLLFAMPLSQPWLILYQSRVLLLPGWPMRIHTTNLPDSATTHLHPPGSSPSATTCETGDTWLGTSRKHSVFPRSSGIFPGSFLCLHHLTRPSQGCRPPCTWPPENPASWELAMDPFNFA